MASDFDDTGLPANDDHAPNEGAHLGDFRVADDEIDQGETEFLEVGDDGEPVAEILEPEQMSRDAFHMVFEKAFSLPGLFIPKWQPLAIQDHEKDAAREASGAIYEILEIWFPSFLVPGGDMLGRFLCILPLAMAKVAVVAAIQKEARADRLAAQSAANDNHKPSAPTVSVGKIGGGMDWMDQEQGQAA